MSAHHHSRLCARWRWLPTPPFCGLWYCPLHGFDVRSRRCWKSIQATRNDYSYAINVFHPNQRADGYSVATWAATLRRSFEKTFLGSRLLILPHVDGADHHDAPLPHLHCLAACPLILTTTKMRRWEEKISFFDPIRILPDCRWGTWDVVRNAQAHLNYVYQVTENHRDLPSDRLPRRGQGYRQVHGRL